MWRLSRGMDAARIEVNKGMVNQMTISELRCEYLAKPLGIDTDKPRFSWEIEGPRRQVTQAAYHLRIASTREALDCEESDLWDTGRLESDETLHIEYQCKQIASGSVYFPEILLARRYSLMTEDAS
jgi:alpha-L-rhamnosidase